MVQFFLFSSTNKFIFGLSSVNELFFFYLIDKLTGTEKLYPLELTADVYAFQQCFHQNYMLGISGFIYHVYFYDLQINQFIPFLVILCYHVTSILKLKVSCSVHLFPQGDL